MASDNDKDVVDPPDQRSALDRKRAPADPAHPIRNPDLAHMPERPIATVSRGSKTIQGNAASNEGLWLHDESGPAKYVVNVDDSNSDASAATKANPKK